MQPSIKELIKFSAQEPLFASFLHKKGFYSQLLYEYVKNGWLENVANGVYKLPDDSLDSLKIVKNIQVQLGLPVHIASRSALFLNGISHFSRNIDKLQVAINGKQRLTKWLKSLDNLDFIRFNIFKNFEFGLESKEEMLISCRELAFIEMAELVPKKVSYEEFYKTLELAPNLRDDVLQRLLEDCTSNKAKRVFLASAESLNYSWFKQLNIKKINFGTGILQLTKNGVYNSKYKIYLERISG